MPILHYYSFSYILFYPGILIHTSVAKNQTRAEIQTGQSDLTIIRLQVCADHTVREILV